MKHFLNTFVTSEDGAITVDWVVLTAAIIGLALIVVIPVLQGADGASHDIADYIASLNAGYGNN